MNSCDFSLTQRLIAGDENAYNTIFRQYYKDLCIFVSRYSGPLECEEIVQDIMLWLWENRTVLPQELSIKPFLFSAAKNKCINTITHKRVKNRVLTELLAEYENVFHVSNYYEKYERKEIFDLLAKALEELPPEYKEAFELNRFQNMTYTEIAKKMGVSSKTIAYRISQTLKKLRVVFKDYLLSLLFLS